MYDEAIKKSTELNLPETNLKRPLRMLCVTYNMAAKVFEKTSDYAKLRKPAQFTDFCDGYHEIPGQAQVDDLFRRNDCWHDIYVLATQEAERSINSSFMDDSKT